MLDSSPRILGIDGFGNLVTNLKPPVRPMRIHSHYITAAAKTYWDAKANEPFVYVGSMGYLEIGVREQRADRMLGARAGMAVESLSSWPGRSAAPNRLGWGGAPGQLASGRR